MFTRAVGVDNESFGNTSAALTACHQTPLQPRGWPNDQVTGFHRRTLLFLMAPDLAQLRLSALCTQLPGILTIPRGIIDSIQTQCATLQLATLLYYWVCSRLKFVGHHLFVTKLPSNLLPGEQDG